MARIYISLGSNIDSERHIRAAVAELSAAFGELTLSSVYESKSVGFSGDNFLNLVAGLDSELSVGEVNDTLHAIEDKYGRERSGPKFSSRTLDLDLLLYGDRVGEHDGVALPRDEITKNAFVLWPLAEIAPQSTHPQLGRSYAELWDDFDKEKQPLWPIPFSW
jgi:2-amino-4-hydroxy-6-hydroxymethyldihydropteridine diphosphokinase